MKSQDESLELSAQAWAEKKNQLMEALMYLTARLEEDVERDLFDDFDMHLIRRAELLREIEALDKAVTPQEILHTSPTLSETWIRQLQYLQQKDDRMKKRIRRQQRDLNIGIENFSREKQQVLKTAGVSGKGVNFETQI